jgi:uncharacterized membrane-anchored protein
MGKKRNVSYAAAKAKERKENTPAPRVQMNNKLKLVLGIVALVLVIATFVGKLAINVATPLVLALLVASNLSDAYQYLRYGTTQEDKKRGKIIGGFTVALTILLVYVLYFQ